MAFCLKKMCLLSLRVTFLPGTRSCPGDILFLWNSHSCSLPVFRLLLSTCKSVEIFYILDFALSPPNIPSCFLHTGIFLQIVWKLRSVYIVYASAALVHFYFLQFLFLSMVHMQFEASSGSARLANDYIFCLPLILRFYFWEPYVCACPSPSIFFLTYWFCFMYAIFSLISLRILKL